MNAMKALKALVLAATFLALPAFAGHPVNINQADEAELSAALDGVGLSKAAAIIQYRAQNGPFKHADEMVNVKGIGLRTVEKNREYIRLGKESDQQSQDSAES